MCQASETCLGGWIIAGNGHDGTAWPGLAESSGLVTQAEAVTVALTPSGAATGMAIAEELIADLSGTSVDSTVLIPDRAVALGVSTRTVTAITGATAYDCGIDGEPAMFGGTLGIAAGAANVGLIGPRAFYADTPVRLTASGGSFTCGAVRIAIHYLSCSAPA